VTPIFLRNHDELTLSALTKRLAPPLGNDIDRLVLAHALVLLLPGSPVLYWYCP
jgi:hypothetical protein